MKTSLAWLNRLVSPPLTSAEEAESLLMAVGFPIDSIEKVSSDSLLDVEVTSNRGDCLAHLGLAREIGAKDPSRHVALPDFMPPTRVTAGDSGLTLKVEAAECPRFTARVIRGVKVGPSPDWLKAAIESVGQRSINNVVDVTNFIAFELGNPCHVFDMKKLAGSTLCIRAAREGEMLTTLDGKKRTLKSDELVVADAEKPQSLAGVMGGQDSEVTTATTDVVLEVATWEPVAVRRAARRHQLRTDASHRFERIVDARTLEDASNRATKLILEVAGGEVVGDLMHAGAPLPAPVRVRLRPARVSALLGIEVPKDEIIAILHKLDMIIEPLGRSGDELSVEVPAYRPDLTREIDLIEEVARIKGLDAIPVSPRMTLKVKGPQVSESARREIGSILTGLGFYEAVTFSFCSREDAERFMPHGLSRVEVDDERRKHEPALRPSVVPGLLGSRRANRNARVNVAGGVRLFEFAAVFAQGAGNATQEHINVTLILDCPVSGKTASVGDMQTGVRLMRGAVESLARALSGAHHDLRIEPSKPCCKAYREDGFAKLTLGGADLGSIGIIAQDVQSSFDLEAPVVAAELNLKTLCANYPARAKVETLAAFPAIERDISFIVAEDVTYARIEREALSSKVERLEACTFIGTYRGKQIGAGKKSVTLRLTFRDHSRTLRHEEVDIPAQAVIDHLKKVAGAEVRG